MGGGVDGGNAAHALQVIILGSGGGPQESNTSAFLVRSLGSKWQKGSVVAVDAGVHLSAITRILEETQPEGLGKSEKLALPHTLKDGPFTGLEVHYTSASANAAYVYRNLIDTYLITHPHLDHISGFVINTAGLPGSRPKRLAGLPSTIAAFKNHIFNNVIWPNLSDENNGAGLVTYMRLVEGGSPALGEGEGKGYLEITDGLAVKVWGVSHGHCIEHHTHRGSGSNTGYGSMDASSTPGSLGPTAMGMGTSMSLMSPRTLAHHNNANPNLSIFPGSSAPSGRAGSVSGGLPTESLCVYDSSAYFIRDVSTGREILIFGDVEPDRISLSPRNQQIWREAAPKIASGGLAAIFIECSYDDSQTDDRLYGHLTPRFIIEEMESLATEVRAARKTLLQQREAREASASHEKMAGLGSDKKKRKRDMDENLVARRKAAQARGLTSASGTSVPVSAMSDDAVSPKTVKPKRGSGSQADDYHYHSDYHLGSDSPHLATPTAELSLRDIGLSAPVTPLSVLQPQPPPPDPLLKGLKVVLIHMKDKLDGGPYIGDIILSELEDYEDEREERLGCEFVISKAGDHILL